MDRDVVEGASQARYVTAELLETIQADACKRWGIGSCETCIGGSIAVALGLTRDDMYPDPDSRATGEHTNGLLNEYYNFIAEFKELAEIEFPLIESNIGIWNDKSTFTEVMQAIERAKAKL